VSPLEVDAVVIAGFLEERFSGSDV